jgi:hypothetical protein
MSSSEPPSQLHLNPPPEYEMKLLKALAYFLGRKVEAQALACLSMYLRQSEPRIMSQVKYYAYKMGIHEYDLLDLIDTNPQQVDQLLQACRKVHAPDDIHDVFEP